MEAKEIIDRLNTYVLFTALHKTDRLAIKEAIKYIENAERKNEIYRPNPLFPQELKNVEGD